MIKQVKGNMLDAHENIIGHQVNCRSRMGSGIAKQIRNKYSSVYDEYMKYSSKHSPYDLLGCCQIVKVSDNKYVANLYGQLNYGRSNYKYTNYTALKTTLNDLKVYAKMAGLSVALPKYIGCGLANGDWTVVEKLIDEAFEDYEVTIYDFNK